ncbi:hypothetical protein [Streptomyces sp. NPDC051546]|uniref:hypothetical protein n=1 Tax=Streptomyces sp. NPDC051546 TaxID=3365655 RepID=UPI0037A61D81
MTEVITADTPVTRRTRAHLRAQIAALCALRLLSPYIAGAAAVFATDAVLTPGPAALRLAFLAVIGLAAAWIWIEWVSGWEERFEDILRARLRGGRLWICTACGASASANWWTPDLDQKMRGTLAAPAAHGCIPRRELT